MGIIQRKVHLNNTIREIDTRLNDLSSKYVRSKHNDDNTSKIIASKVKTLRKSYNDLLDKVEKSKVLLSFKYATKVNVAFFDFYQNVIDDIDDKLNRVKHSNQIEFIDPLFNIINNYAGYFNFRLDKSNDNKQIVENLNILFDGVSKSIQSSIDEYVTYYPLKEKIKTLKSNAAKGLKSKQELDEYANKYHDLQVKFDTTSNVFYGNIKNIIYKEMLFKDSVVMCDLNGLKEENDFICSKINSDKSILNDINGDVGGDTLLSPQDDIQTNEYNLRLKQEYEDIMKNSIFKEDVEEMKSLLEEVRKQILEINPKIIDGISEIKSDISLGTEKISKKIDNSTLEVKLEVDNKAEEIKANILELKSLLQQVDANVLTIKEIQACSNEELLSKLTNLIKIEVVREEIETKEENNLEKVTDDEKTFLQDSTKTLEVNETNKIQIDAEIQNRNIDIFNTVKSVLTHTNPPSIPCAAALLRNSVDKYAKYYCCKDLSELFYINEADKPNKKVLFKQHFSEDDTNFILDIWNSASDQIHSGSYDLLNSATKESIEEASKTALEKARRLNELINNELNSINYSESIPILLDSLYSQLLYFNNNYENMEFDKLKKGFFNGSKIITNIINYRKYLNLIGVDFRSHDNFCFMGHFLPSSTDDIDNFINKIKREKGFFPKKKENKQN